MCLGRATVDTLHMQIPQVAVAREQERAQLGVMSTTSESTLQWLHKLVGHWVTEATHPMLPGVTLRGMPTWSGFRASAS
jgi:hypothetical protein